MGQRSHPNGGGATDRSVELHGLKLVQSFSGLPDEAYDIRWSADGKLIAAARGMEVIVWSRASGSLPQRISRGMQSNIEALAWHPSLPTIAIATGDGSVSLWNTETPELRQLCDSDKRLTGVAWAPNESRLAISDKMGGVDIRDSRYGHRIRYRRVHESHTNRICWWPDSKALITCGGDGRIVCLTLDDDLSVLYDVRQSGASRDIAISPDGNFFASGPDDNSVHIWQLANGKLDRILEGHNSLVSSMHFSQDAEFLATASADEVRLWRCHDWECVATIQNNSDWISAVSLHPLEPVLALKNTEHHRIDCYNLDRAKLKGITSQRDSRRYVNAKVVLVGDTGVGKSGLGLVLSGQRYEPTDSTHGRHVWVFDNNEINVGGSGVQTREVLLWDLAGQPSYRLIHQLHLHEVAVALVVFDSRSETDPFVGVKHWVRALSQARRLEGPGAHPLKVFLVAARADRGGIAVARTRVQAMVDELGLAGIFETSAKEGWQVAELAEAIRDNITWNALPTVSSTALFESIKQFLLEEKEEGRLLSTADDLFRSFRRIPADHVDHEDLRASFETCIGLVESRGLIRRLRFGDLILLQPELLDAYASAIILAAKAEPDGLGFIPQEEALDGRFRLAEHERIHDRAKEKLLLIATVEELLRHEIALQEATDRGVDLVFPSQFTRERPDAPDIPGKQVIFTFEGALYSIYASLAVRISHSIVFQRKAMWQNAASYAATAGGSCGIHLRELEEGLGELTLSYDERAGAAVRIQFETYVSDYLQFRAIPGTITRRRIRSCQNCGYSLPDDLVQRRLELRKTTLNCPLCDESTISLLDAALSFDADFTVAEMKRSADERRAQNVAAAQLRGKIETMDYDVFLCHNSRDRERIVAIGEQLKERGILPWLDIWEIRPGTRWQKELRRQIGSVKSAAVFIGAKGSGPWQELEVESLLQEIIKRKRPIIPVILEGRQGKPKLPAFLDSWHMVDMRQNAPDPFEQLIWGITGQRPS